MKLLSCYFIAWNLPNFGSKKVRSERGYLVPTLASRLGVPGSNPMAALKSCEVYPGLGILQLADCCHSISLKKCIGQKQKNYKLNQNYNYATDTHLPIIERVFWTGNKKAQN